MKSMLKRILVVFFSTVIACIAGVIIAFAIFVASIGIYAEFIMPDLVKGSTVAYDITRCFQLETSQLDCLVEQKILTQSELEIFESDSLVRRDVVWRTVLPAYGIYPYPANIYPNLPFSTVADTPAEQPYIDARVAAIVYGLADVNDNPDESMTQKEYEILITRLETETVNLSPCYSDCPYLANQVWDAETYRGRNSLLIGWELIPDAWRNDFIAQNWQINFILPSTLQTETGEISRHEVSGSTDYKAKTISLDTSDPATTVHEFAHYAAYRAGWLYDLSFEANYIAEASAVVDLLGDYSQTNPREYFAEFVTFWILHPAKQPELKTLAPETSVWVEQIISDFSLLVLSTEAP